MFLVAFALSFASCALNVKVGGNSDKTVNQGFAVLGEDSEETERMAIHGDVNSALRLANHWEIYIMDYDEAARWLQLASSHGSDAAKIRLENLQKHHKHQTRSNGL